MVKEFANKVHEKFWAMQFLCSDFFSVSHPVKIDLNKELDSKQKTIQTLNINAQGFRKTKNENSPKQKIGVTSSSVPVNVPIVGRSTSTS